MDQAILKGCWLAENKFLEAQHKSLLDKSGSCALIAVQVNDLIHVANVGDSRAFVSEKFGRVFHTLSNDHKPDSISERKRILKFGGQVMQMDKSKVKLPQNLLAKVPYRIFPGGLSVSRSFGDIQAKDPALGGKKGVLIADPELMVYRVHSNTDFLLLGCDGIFDVFSTLELHELIWSFIQRKGIKLPIKASDLEEIINHILLNALKRQSFDNLTVIFVAFNL